MPSTRNLPFTTIRRKFRLKNRKVLEKYFWITLAPPAASSRAVGTVPVIVTATDHRYVGHGETGSEQPLEAVRGRIYYLCSGKRP